MIDALDEVHSRVDRVSIVQTIVDLAALPVCAGRGRHPSVSRR